ncbi:MAG: hypothetical protein GF320_01825 [Armatimonadia bacterium]|nr:hypothetical protein [Armatimonadia bacterium]
MGGCPALAAAAPIRYIPIMDAQQVNADVLVYVFGHKFASEWSERKTDPIFGRTPPDARFRKACLADVPLSEKSLAEEIMYACLAQLCIIDAVEATVYSEKGWNFEVYDRVYLQPVDDFPAGPVFEALQRSISRGKTGLLIRTRRRFEERGIAVDQLVAGVRKYRYLRGDPYQYVCSEVEKHLIDIGLYKRESQRVFGPFIAPLWLPDEEKMGELEFALLRLEQDLERFEMEDPLLAECLRDNICRTMLKMRSDEDYVNDRMAEEDGDEGGESGDPLARLFGRDEEEER